MSVKEATELYTWGKSVNDQLGYQLRSKQTCQRHPKRVHLARSVVQISCNKYHSACVTENRELYVWGIGGAAQRLGINNADSYVLPTLHPFFMATHPCVQVCCGRDHTMARTAHGVVFCWGSNQYSQCSMVAPEPQKVDLPGKAKGIACGDFCSFALTDEDVFVWGKDALGCGETVPLAPHPRQIPSLSHAQEVFAAADVAAVRVQAGILVWGHGLTRPSKVRLDESGEIEAVHPQLDWKTVRVHAQLVTVHIGLNKCVAIDQMGKLWAWNHGTTVAHRAWMGELCVKQVISYDSCLLCVTKDGDLFELQDSTMSKLLTQVENVVSNGEHIASLVKYKRVIEEPLACVPSLEEICQRKLCDTIAPRFALDLLNIAVDFGFMVLHDAVVAFLALNQMLIEVLYGERMSELVAPQILEFISGYNRGECVQDMRERGLCIGNSGSFPCEERPIDAMMPDVAAEKIRLKIAMKAEIEAVPHRMGRCDWRHTAWHSKLHGGHTTNIRVQADTVDVTDVPCTNEIAGSTNDSLVQVLDCSMNAIAEPGEWIEVKKRNYSGERSETTWKSPASKLSGSPRNRQSDSRREYALTEFIKPAKKAHSSNSTLPPARTWNTEPEGSASLKEIMNAQEKLEKEKRAAFLLRHGTTRGKPKMHDSHNSWGREAMPQEKIVEDFMLIQAQEKLLREEENLEKEILEIEAAFTALALAEKLDKDEREQWARQCNAKKRAKWRRKTDLSYLERGHLKAAKTTCTRPNGSSLPQQECMAADATESRRAKITWRKEHGDWNATMWPRWTDNDWNASASWRE